MSVAITGIFARVEDAVCVCFEIKSEDGAHTESERFIISASQMARLGLAKGEADEELYETVEREARLYEATRRALRSLEFGACSKKALRIKLVRAGFDRECAERAVELLEREGLMNDSETACREAERALKKLWGPRRIEAELYKKGYGADCVRNALRHIDRVGADYVANCKSLVRKKLRSNRIPPDGTGKLFAALQRYGYTSSEIREALSELGVGDGDALDI